MDAAPLEPDPRPDLSPDDRRARPRIDPGATAHRDAAFSVARASEPHDDETARHAQRIRLVVEQLARRMGFDEAEAEALGCDAMLHDVGKIALPPDLLRTPRPLRDDERTIVEAHTVHGEGLLGDDPLLARAAEVARSHHERFDGRGYPDALAGRAIPLAARVTAVADVLDALLSARSYKDGWGFEHAMAEICRLAGTHLDPEVVEALRRCNADGCLCDIYGIAPQCVVLDEATEQRSDDATEG